VQDLAINLLASVLAGLAVWVGQRLLAYRRLARERAFFGLAAGVSCRLVVGRHASSQRENSVHRGDVAALVELATLVRECGARAEMIGATEAPTGVGQVTEFCVGGPTTNPRTAAHMRALLPGVRLEPYEKSGRGLTLTVGMQRYARRPDRVDHAILARCGGTHGRPLFVLIGQTATANLAAARYLAAHHRALRRTYGERDDFCLVLRVPEPDAYGADRVELVGDVTAEATTPRSPASSAG
jgi:hypothetical protein